MAVFFAGLLLASGCAACTAPTSNPPSPLPHGGSAPPTSREPLSDGQITQWLAAIQRYYQLAEANSVPRSALRACYLVTRGQAEADLSHPASPWYLQGPLLGSPPRVDPNALECVLSGPATGVGLGTAYGDAGCSIRIHTAASPTSAPTSTRRETAIPGTSWFVDYTAWHRRQPTGAELEWVVNDLVHNLAVRHRRSHLRHF
ncbi:MAG TPA: hypothetical protein VJ914_32235 [Pseudonocardiaceae bacterium]|nr:hypothetical protein [Pseudonocardiaceae bacterium]